VALLLALPLEGTSLRAPDMDYSFSSSLTPAPTCAPPSHYIRTHAHDRDSRSLATNNLHARHHRDYANAEGTRARRDGARMPARLPARLQEWVRKRARKRERAVGAGRD
jgi:hypothetical protein